MIVDFSITDHENPTGPKTWKELSSFNRYVAEWEIEKRIDEAHDKMLIHDTVIQKKVQKDDQAYKEEVDKKKVDEKNLRKYIEGIKAKLEKGRESRKRKTAREGEGKNEKKEKKEDGGN
ncbi:unnamed protein product, partial [Mesorhabditis belari]|uniref:Uncharacterized protein n=1 Tax=Mesorhabditis belari TaxID=2138241 RepID=A0AAF3ETU9_9BILA